MGLGTSVRPVGLAAEPARVEGPFDHFATLKPVGFVKQTCFFEHSSLMWLRGLQYN